jgi:pimeloyl-ACP methyl ester carboxylesterase
MFNETPLYFFLSPVMRFVFSIMGFPKGVSSEAMRYVIACAACISFDEHAENLSGLLQPVLSIWCADDPLIEPASFQALKKMIPLCAEMKFEAGGHNPQKKYATEVAQKIIGFVSSLKK